MVHTERAEKSYHISQVALDSASFQNSNLQPEVQVWVRVNHQDYLLATLNQTIAQVHLDLAFGANEKAKYSIIGSGHVYLTGYYVPAEYEESAKADAAVMQVEDNANGHALQRLQDGVIVEDIEIGDGHSAQNGDFVYICYENRLNDKIVSRYKSPDGLKLTLGNNDIIRGWDIGIIGMMEGSKRRLICPPNVAYGPNGLPPLIPKDSTLISEISVVKIEQALAIV